MDLSIETQFKSPSFALWKQGIELLQDLHGRLVSLTELSLSDMHYQTGPRLSDVRVTVSLFGDRASIEITSEKYKTAFKNLRTVEDLSLCRTCIGKSQQAVEAYLPDMIARASSVQMTVRIEFEDRSKFITQRPQLAAQAIPPHSLPRLSNLTNAPRWHVDVENPVEFWATSLTLQPGPAENEMILHGYVLYWSNSMLQNQANCIDHSIIVLQSVLESLTVKASTQLWRPHSSS